MNNKKIFILIIILLVAFVSITVVNMLINNSNNKGQVTFTATVLENKGTSIMVQPEDGEDELRSSDKIVVRLPKDSAVLEDLSQFSVGRKVKITYDGTIMESYPAQINATKIEFAE